MRALGQVLAKEFGHNHGIDVPSYTEVVVGSIRTPLRILLGAVFFVLLIACFNVANLLLAAGLSRRREIAVRLALGAGQRDVARQLTSEALLLAAAGGTLGWLLAVWIVRVFVALAANSLPRAGTVHMDGRVLAFTALIGDRGSGIGDRRSEVGGWRLEVGEAGAKVAEYDAVAGG